MYTVLWALSFDRISDGPELVSALYFLKKQHPKLNIMQTWHASLSEDSPDWYESVEEEYDTPPFYIRLVPGYRETERQPMRSELVRSRAR